VIKGRPCKIVDMSTSKTGKHGHAKVHLVAIDIFTGKKLEELCPSTHNMDVPNVSRTEYQFSYIDDEFLQLIKPDGSEKNDVRVPDGELGDRIREYEEAGTDIRKLCHDSSLRNNANSPSSCHHHLRYG
jgi:translation initiation factor 5A